MNRFNLWRYFGSLPDIPESAYTGDPDEAISALRKKPEELALLFKLAMRFSRLDSLKETLTADDWDDSADGLLNRGRLRFYRALAENPETPSPEVLDEAANDFRRAADYPSTSCEALAGLVRIHALVDGIPAAVKHLRNLERLGGLSAHQAAAGALLFLSGIPGTDEVNRRKFLKKARRHLSRSGTGEGISFIRFLVDLHLDSLEKARNQLAALAVKGALEARIMLIQDDIKNWQKNPRDAVRDTLMVEIAEYKRLRPSDPRGFVAEGDLLLSEDSESAHMAWRTALLLDDRCTESWIRLGFLYKKAWEGSTDPFQNTWLEAAQDAFLKAVTLSPLNPSCRLALGITERESGRPARAVGTLLGGLALSRNEEDFRRWIAICWNDLAVSPDLSYPARSAAAGRARVEWDLLLGKGHRLPADLLGILRSMALEIIGEPVKAEELESRIPGLTAELIQNYPREDSIDLVGLAEYFTLAGFLNEAEAVLNFISVEFPDNPGVKAAWGGFRGTLNPAESMRLFIEAASAVEADEPEYINWLLNASDMAASAGRFEDEESILLSGLSHQPENLSLLKRLSEKLLNEDCVTEALELYRKSLRLKPGDLDLLEDAVWFFRAAGSPELAEASLRQALENKSDNPRLWNQFGVHFMETGWDEEAGSMKSESLESAIHAYRRAVEKMPENTVFMGNLGDALRQSGRLTEAWELLSKAVEGGSDSSEDAFAINSLARLEDERSYAAEGSDSSAADWENSGKHYRLAAVNGGGNSDFQRDYAWWLYRERRLEEAIDFYQRAGEIAPSDESFPYGEYSCFLELGNEKSALEALEKALLIKPSDSGMLVDKADLLGSMGDAEAGERLYREILINTEKAAWALERMAVFCTLQAEKTEPANPAPIVSLDNPGMLAVEDLITRVRTSDGDKWRLLALNAWEDVRHLEPDNSNARAGFAAALLAVGRREEAGELLKKETGNPDAMNLLGRLELLDSSLRRQARIHLDAAVSSNPDISRFHADIGYWYYLEHQWEKALEAFRQAADRAPHSPEYAANTGICAYASGYFEEAVVYLQRALAMGGEQADWQNALGLSLMASGSPLQALEAFRSACLENPFSEIFPANLAMAHESLHTPSDTLQ